MKKQSTDITLDTFPGTYPIKKNDTFPGTCPIKKKKSRVFLGTYPIKKKHDAFPGTYPIPKKKDTTLQ